ncbi:Non-specific serine/threonine protein kinase protein [Dioscorea alata]|uniref:Non-specific serine/threonine protein kinase protein n=1 Tax=Dioscorea alata TaxID=55571 RepID=A0ACB7VUS5_DIOAL|nr:Non-specific serine/threonine protein kinase protein [Dioscorea alata]
MCPDKCGTLTIPFPFGLTDGCYLSGFKIRCNTTFNPPQAFLDNANHVPVLNISEDVLIISNRVAGRNCQGIGTQTKFNQSRPYTFSSTRNMFTAIGCDTLAIFSAGNNSDYLAGCVSMCTNLSSIINGSCSGHGCCQTSIPSGLKRFDISLSTISDKIRHNYSQNGSKYCSKAFLVDKDQFVFNTSFIYSDHLESLPVVLDWAIGNKTCEVARRSEHYACKQENTRCVDSINGQGYRCSCQEGFQGNPYLPLPSGCQDVNECASPKTNDCTMKCQNIPGSHLCLCPTGYQGDGKINGTGCVKTLNSKSQLLQIILACGLGVFFLLVVSTLLVCWGVKKRRMIKLKEKFFEQNGGLLMQQLLSSHQSTTKSARIFTADELERATDNYNQSRVLGRGGYGIVYKGIFPPDNQLVAIKKSKFMENQINQIDQFINEVVILSQVIHMNVVRILGCCLETPVPLLVYEYVPGGTLYHHIHERRGSLSWSSRLKIAIDTAGALAYLHSATARPIFHRDIKSTNILLDDNYMAKVSDFGASRLIPQDKDHITTIVQGTLGYLDPEYYYSGVLTEKSDVYSFGVVLAELLTGEKPISQGRGQEEKSLAIYFVLSVERDSLFDILEPRVKKEVSREQLQGVVEVAMSCLRDKGEERPTMKSVQLELQRLISYGDQDIYSLHAHDQCPLDEHQTDESFVVKSTRYYNWSRIEDESLLRGSTQSHSASFEITNASGDLGGSSMPFSRTSSH